MKDTLQIHKAHTEYVLAELKKPKYADRHMHHKEPRYIATITYPDGRTIKYIPPPNNPHIVKTTYPDGRIINH